MWVAERIPTPREHPREHAWYRIGLTDGRLLIYEPPEELWLQPFYRLGITEAYAKAYPGRPLPWVPDLSKP